MIGDRCGPDQSDSSTATLLVSTARGSSEGTPYPDIRKELLLWGLEEVNRVDWVTLGESEANNVTSETRELGVG